MILEVLNYMQKDETIVPIQMFLLIEKSLAKRNSSPGLNGKDVYINVFMSCHYDGDMSRLCANMTIMSKSQLHEFLIKIENKYVRKIIIIIIIGNRKYYKFLRAKALSPTITQFHLSHPYIPIGFFTVLKLKKKKNY